MECHEKEFGWLWKNVGGHFPCLLHGMESMLIHIFIINKLNYNYPAAMPIRKITRCQYSCEKPIREPHKLNNTVAIANSCGLQ